MSTNVSVQKFISKGTGGSSRSVKATVPSNLSDKLNRKTEDVSITPQQRSKIEYQRISLVEGLPQLQIIASIESVYSEEKIKRISVCDIDNPDISNPRSPMPNSLYDPLMGTVVADRSCTTCQNVNCLGHYGRIPLAYPLPHPLWIGTIKNILTSVCNNCGHLLVSKKMIEYRGLNHASNWRRIESIAAAAESVKICPYSQSCPDMSSGKITHCTANPTYKLSQQEDSYDISEIPKTKRTVKGGPKAVPTRMDVRKILSILKSIPDRDAKLMGFKEDSRPEDLIMQSLLVMPPISRPPFIADGRNNPDELTEQYKQIVNCANQLKLEPDNDNIRSKLFIKIKGLMVGRKQQYKTKVPKSSISTQLQGKKAVPRNSLMGKRTNMCARTVISPDTSLEFGQIRVPEEWAPMLNIPEMVREDNIEMLQAEIKRGKIAEVHTYHESTGGFQRKIANLDTVLKIGDKAWRHLRNGDVVALNRQPTLHKFSMMAFEVVLGKERTLGLHFAYTTPYGADHDGDADADAFHTFRPQQEAAIEVGVDISIGKQCKHSQVYNFLVISSICII